jgi:uncharacterized protein
MKRILKFAFYLFLLLNVVVCFHAYKFTHFYDKGEVVLKQPEQMSGWDKFKTMVFGINAEKNTRNEKPDSITNFETVRLSTSDGANLEAWLFPPAKDSVSKGTVLLFHGHASNKTKLLGEQASFAGLGYQTLLVDFRAHGNSSGNTCTIGMKETNDVLAAYEYIAGRGEKNIILWGISLGGATVLHARAEFANIKPTAIISEMPFGSLYQAVKGRVRVMGLPEEPIATLLTFWGGTMHGRWAFNMSPKEDVKNIATPTLILWGKKDPRVTAQEIEELFANAAASNKKMVVFESSAHQSLCNNEHAKWLTTVTDFLNSLPAKN